MRFDKVLPEVVLTPYIKYYAISENDQEAAYKVFPVTGLVIGFQYRGHLSVVDDVTLNRLSSSGITGISDRYRLFRNSPGIGTILVYFTETGFARFSALPANELFNESLSLHQVFDRYSIERIEEALSLAETDAQRIGIMNAFFLSQLKDVKEDALVTEAVKLIYVSKGDIPIRTLSEKLFISQSPLEKRFRRLVGATPKKFASIVRFNAIIGSLGQGKSLTDICYEHGFFDQAHFIKDFKQYTGDTPERYRRGL
ncbi:AraC family transcriptional regulator [Filimonas effusa]|uniref:AraC family transcriptional regulator n=1 Tax=Filimonas effusa TaxID=2508721 RepID=A0A4Q1DEE0_9BACT|nr:helix-turn-helix domain-containing protein [Filimonas effusa]RXK87275.1 AraC family transcriptional regulator [Filimonas effusa]